MTKTELAAAIAEKFELTKKTSGEVVDFILESIVSEVKKKDGAVSFVGFGSFTKTKRAARTARNPRTGEPLKIAASNVPKFKPGAAFKAAINPAKK
jgi:DNA-binding protein HU-beta